MVGVLTIYRTSIGKKVIMAVTGLIGIGFVAFHMYGNLKIFEFMTGPEYLNAQEHFNEYAHTLRTIGEPIFGYTHLLWLARIVLLLAFVLHVWAAYSLALESRAARPEGYTKRRNLQANYASLYMRYGGTILLIFIIFHIMHFTWGVPGIHPDFSPEDPYRNVVVGFQSYGYLLAIIYILVMLVLAPHLYHGTWSLFQTLGFNNHTYTKSLRVLSATVALVVTIGFILVPLAVILGIVS